MEEERGWGLGLGNMLPRDTGAEATWVTKRFEVGGEEVEVGFRVRGGSES